jgi:hypothetical protein
VSDHVSHPYRTTGNCLLHSCDFLCYHLVSPKISVIFFRPNFILSRSNMTGVIFQVRGHYIQTDSWTNQESKLEYSDLYPKHPVVTAHDIFVNYNWVATRWQ